MEFKSRLAKRASFPSAAILFSAVISLLPFLSLASAGDITESVSSELRHAIEEFRRENYEEAVHELELVKEWGPDASVASYYLGLSYKEMMEYDKAAKHLKDATTMKPGVKDAFYDLAEMYYRLNDDASAVAALENAERLSVRPGQTAFLRGLILSRKNEHEKAIESFKKASSIDPSMKQSADYRTGLALIKLGKLDEAEKLLSDVVTMDPNSDIAAFAREHVDTIDRRRDALRPYRFYASAGYETDDNVFLKPSDETAAGGATGEHDTRLYASLRAEYAPRLGGPLGIKAQYSFYANRHSDMDPLDVMSNTFSLIPSYRSKNGTLSLLLSTNLTDVDDEDYMIAHTASPAYLMVLKPGLMLQTGLRYRHKEYINPALMDDEDRDVNEYAAFAGIYKIFDFLKNDAVANARAEYIREDADGVNWSNEGARASAGLVLPLPYRLRFSASGDLLYQRFDDRHTVFLDTREDMTWTAVSAFTFSFCKNADLEFKYTFTRGDSTIAVYDYQREVGAISMNVMY
jgi:tetratricopeptide (TPR) repeat protein